MIFRGPAPESFESDFAFMVQEKLEEFYYSENRSQKRYDFPFNRRFDEEVKGSLEKVFHGKCGYCERAVGDGGFVDRFRPHSGVREDIEFHQDLYWWLTFEWDNLVYCCRECARYKANYFPVVGKRAKNPGDDLESEYHLLFDPCTDEAERHFTFDISGTIHPLTDKGRQTIELLRLNRTSLRAEREAARWEMADLVRLVLSEGRNALATLQSIYKGEPVAGHWSFRKWWLLAEIETDPSLAGLMGIMREMVEAPRRGAFVPTTRIVENDYFPIEQMRIRNFKGIDDLLVDFKPDGSSERSWLFLLGENGAGKSSILQAIALGLRVDAAVLTPRVVRGLIQKGQEEAEITIKERDSDNVVRTVLRRSDGSVRQEGVFNSFLFGYGSLRLSAEDAEARVDAAGVDAARVDGARVDEDKGAVSYENLFHPVRPLNDVTAWLKRVHREDAALFDRVAIAIKQLLPHDFSDNELTVVGGEVAFRNSEKSFASLSDGFKSTIILAVDIMMKLSGANTDMDKLSGVVLIDELGNQLHPRWQMRIVEQLRKVFTNLNFIVSTHHPLCLRGSQVGEILLLRQAEGGLVPVTDLPDPAPMRVDQLLASEFFGLNSLMDPEQEATFNRYYALLAREGSLTDKERDELVVVKDQLRKKKYLGSSPREELMYAVIDSLLASKVGTFNREQLKEKTIRRVSELWSQIKNR